jgi:hypothetical protein
MVYVAVSTLQMEEDVSGAMQGSSVYLPDTWHAGFQTAIPDGFETAFALQFRRTGESSRRNETDDALGCASSAFPGLPFKPQLPPNQAASDREI